MHLDCLPDRAPGPCSISRLSEALRVLGYTVPLVEVSMEGDSWEQEGGGTHSISGSKAI